jgi:hypothetical protein
MTGGAPTTAPATQPGVAGAAPAKPATSRQRAAVMQALRTIFGAPGAPAPADAAQPKPRDAGAGAARPATQPVALAETWHVRLVNGDVLTGALRAWSGQRVTLHVQSGGGSVALEIPVAHVAELWHTTPEQARRAKRNKSGAPNGAADAVAEDVAYVLKDGEIVTVSGVALGIEDTDKLAFRYEGADRKINLARLAGVVLVPQRGSAASAPPADHAFHQVFRLSNGHVLSGRWTALRDNTVTLKTLWGQAVELPRAAVQTIDCRNGRVVYLSDLEPARVEQTPYFDRVIPWRRDAGLGGGKLALVDGQYDRGLALHARCVLEYDLGARFDRFRARLGFEHPAGTSGRAAVSLTADGRTIYANPDARGDTRPAELDLDVSGAQRLVLEVDFGQDQDVADRVVFANARLLRADVGRPQP